MSSRVGTITVFVVLAGFIGGSIYVLGTRGTELLGPEPKAARPADPPQPSLPPEPRQPVSEPATPSPVSPAMELEAAQRVRSGVYRCVENGATVYSDQPCPNADVSQQGAGAKRR